MKELTRVDFSYMDADDAANCTALQTEVFRLIADGCTLTGDALLNLAAGNLGNADERYCGIFFCLGCGQMYHQDYSEAEKVDFCSGECEAGDETQ
jgi:hypothetical protein